MLVYLSASLQQINEAIVIFVHLAAHVLSAVRYASSQRIRNFDSTT